MEKTALVIMAAGIGSRFGKGIKQLEPVGPNGEIIMDYSIHDALEAGFDKVVFVIRKNLEKEFRECIGNRIEKITEVSYVFQELDDIPERFRDRLEGRVKPWGTGQAILACRDAVKEPFLVINADDYYGKEAFREAYGYLTRGMRGRGPEDPMHLCMVGFVLGNTLSKNGTVTRGVCRVDADAHLAEIEETYEIRQEGGHAAAVRGGEKIELPLDTAVSMNMWGLPAEFIGVLESGFIRFLEELGSEDAKGEYLLPRIIGEMLEAGQVQVDVLYSHDKWFGVTYQKDRDEVVEEIRKLTEAGVYPPRLYEDLKRENAGTKD